jgi:NTP pyrophosphatase (non-canonical NTP hydrolase)
MGNSFWFIGDFVVINHRWLRMVVTPLTKKEPNKMNMLWNTHTALVTGTIKPGTEEDKRFLSLALCGEAGELANVIKKHWRGDIDPLYLVKVFEEIGDVHAYTELLACAYGVTLEYIRAEIILPKLKKRWPDSFRGEAILMDSQPSIEFVNGWAAARANPDILLPSEYWKE